MAHSTKRIIPWSPWLAAPAALALAVVAWTSHEVRHERREVEGALRAQAELLARALGPALATASASARELDELLAWKLLDNARLLAALEQAASLPEDTREAVAEANGLDAVLRYGRDGALRWETGDAGGAIVAADLAPLLSGGADELILGSVRHLEGAPLAAAVRSADGGALVAVAHRETALAFGRRVGLVGLLEDLVRTGPVLYVAYSEEPSGLRLAASWDGGTVPGQGAEPAPALRGRPVFQVSVPVGSPAGRSASLQVGLDGAPLERAVGSAALRTALLGSVLGLLGVLSAAVVVVQRARERDREESRQRVARLEEERRRGERLAAAGTLAAGIAHEIRNPLNGISVAAQRIQRLTHLGHAERELAERISEEVTRLEGTVQGFLDLARPSHGPRQESDLGELIRDAVALIALEAAEREIEILHLGGPAPAVIDREAVRRAVVNLVRNAVDASPRGGRVEVEVAVGSSGPEGLPVARIAVRDEGEGVDPELGDRAFDPFVTTKGWGSGLGLALVRRVAQEHDGRVGLGNRHPRGAEALFELPRQGASP